MVCKLAVWRLQNHDNFVGTWLSDYFTNTLGLSLDTHEANHEPVGNHPLNIYIEKWLVPDNGGFTMPLPTSPDALQPFLDGIEVAEWQDIAITDIRSDIKGLGDKLQEILAQENMSPYRLNELNYLATRIEGLDEYGLEIFAANIEAGRNCATIADIINLTFNENINCFDVQPAFSEEMYGEFQIDMVLPDKHAGAFHRLNESDDPADQALAAYIEKLEAHVDKKVDSPPLNL